MLTPPALSDGAIVETVRATYGLRIRQVAFLPLGADASAAVYRVEGKDGTPYFLKLRRDDFDEIAVAVPAFLRAQGIRQVMAPIATTTGRLWASGQGFAWILYPFFAGQNGYEAALSDARWVTFGQSVRAVHATSLPPALARRVPREDYSARWREVVSGFDHQLETRAYDDPVADVGGLLAHETRQIRALVARAEQLANSLRARADAVDSFVLCHTDLHAGKSPAGMPEASWPSWTGRPASTRPRERDLMSALGVGVSESGATPREEALFYAGYGSHRNGPDSRWPTIATSASSRTSRSVR